MPKIVRLHEFGGPEQLQIDDIPTPQPGPGEVRLRIEAASINRDQFTFMAGKQFKEHGYVQPVLPSRLGYECAGVVEAVGKGVEESWIGKRVAPMPGYDESRYGTLGAEAILPARFLSEYPINLTPEQASAFWVAYLTSYGVFIAIAPVAPGDNSSWWHHCRIWVAVASADTIPTNVGCWQRAYVTGLRDGGSEWEPATGSNR